ncbi:redoxin [Pseudoalteromonas sp. MM17-2]|uniref:redoxin n=1 Tax=Pseudoalteromonas sp. MM17-2 TaxID=2917753 RepID=UPI001EF72CFD|nr:redoxin [Pseudoalteromonas sp. MM17-2]MCG7542852.1 redoxin [Pseudoalteromonas sp. MM17-2]
MKTIVCFIITLISSAAACEEIKSEDWLLWHSLETHLPFSSSLAIYPPVILDSDNGVLRGSIATPYALSGDANRIIDKFLIVVTDAAGSNHFLEPKLESVGFVNESGISMSSLTSRSFHNGKVFVQLYKHNSPENRKELRALKSENVQETQCVHSTLEKMNVPQPKAGQFWGVKASTLTGQNVKEIVAASAFTIVQLYSPYCAFCRKAIQSNNLLNDSKRFSIVGMAGVSSVDEFKQHLSDNDVQYPFIAYEGECTESALLRAAGQRGFPTYLILDSTQKVHDIFIGTSALEAWLETQAL